MALTTPETIRTLQRKLYAKAKHEPAYRFYDSTTRSAGRMSSIMPGGSSEPIEAALGLMG